VPAHPTVLHVDDDPSVLELSSDWAADAGVTWVTAADPDAGLSVLADRDVDCLVSDSMHTGDGDPFVVRAVDVVPELSVILFTATDRETLERRTRRTVAAYVEKGSTDQFATLFDHVSALAGRSGADGGDAATPGQRPVGGDRSAAWVTIGNYAPNDGGPDLATTIVTAVDEYADRDVSTVAPLYESIDAEVLETLLRRPDGASRADIEVRFPFAEYELAVTSGGRILLRPETT
jgi:CheY-like chemotaxis protein